VDATEAWTWALIAALTVLALAPLAFAVLRRGAGLARGRREADVALYRAQLAELARERDAGRLDAEAFRAATLEVQRRLLASPDDTAPATGARSGDRPKDATPAWAVPVALLAAAMLVPAFALRLYLQTGVPDMPSAPYAERREALDRDDALLATLRARLAQLDPGSEAARAGQALLGDAERARGRPEAAAAAYGASLAAGFEAEVAGQLAQVLLEADRVEEARTLLAEALPRAPQHIGLRFLSGLAEARSGRPELARAAWQALIAEAPEGAPWRAMVQRRMADLP
jgi:cytochrome c-type biogenesis protein CcmH